MAVQFSLCGCMCAQSTLELGPLCTTTPLQRLRGGREGNTEGRLFLLTRRGFKCEKKPALFDIHFKNWTECGINSRFTSKRSVKSIQRFSAQKPMTTLIPFGVWESARRQLLSHVCLQWPFFFLQYGLCLAAKLSCDKTKGNVVATCNPQT